MTEASLNPEVNSALKLPDRIDRHTDLAKLAQTTLDLVSKRTGVDFSSKSLPDYSQASEFWGSPQELAATKDGKWKITGIRSVTSEGNEPIDIVIITRDEKKSFEEGFATTGKYVRMEINRTGSRGGKISYYEVDSDDPNSEGLTAEVGNTNSHFASPEFYSIKVQGRSDDIKRAGLIQRFNDAASQRAIQMDKPLSNTSHAYLQRTAGIVEKMASGELPVILQKAVEGLPDSSQFKPNPDLIK